MQYELQILTHLYVKNDSQILKTVTECKYLGVMLSDDSTCTKDVERAKASFSKQFYSLYDKFYCVDQRVLIHLFKLHATSSFGVETWFIETTFKRLKRYINSLS